MIIEPHFSISRRCSSSACTSAQT